MYEGFSGSIKSPGFKLSPKVLVILVGGYTGTIGLSVTSGFPGLPLIVPGLVVNCASLLTTPTVPLSWYVHVIDQSNF